VRWRKKKNKKPKARRTWMAAALIGPVTRCHLEAKAMEAGGRKGEVGSRKGEVKKKMPYWEHTRDGRSGEEKGSGVFFVFTCPR
jgi:hypothetical protein